MLWVKMENDVGQMTPIHADETILVITMFYFPMMQWKSSIYGSCSLEF